MTLPIRNTKDFWSGLIYLVLGAVAIYMARDYGMGTATRMGPAYFPIVLGGLLALIGAASLVRSFLGHQERIGVFAFKGMALVFVGTVLFAALLRGAGVIVALAALVLIGAYASVKFRWGSALALTVGLIVFCALVFVKGLGVPLPLLGSWFGG